MANLKYLGTKLTNWDCIYEEIKSRLHLVSCVSEPFVFLSSIYKRKVKIHKPVIFPVVLYECEIWYHAKARTRRIFGNKLLRRIFGRKTDEVTEDWRKLHNKDIHRSYYSENDVSMIK